MDYAKLKVTELKDELKKRGIPTTKLTRKQDIIDRLVEDDAQTTGTGANPEETEVARENDAEIMPTIEEVEPLEHEVDVPLDQPVAPPIELPAEGASTFEAQSDAPQALPEAKATETVESKTVKSPIAEELTTQQSTIQDTSDTPQAVSEAPAQEATQPSTPSQLSGDESRKRKRRSATPSVSQDSAKKKLRDAHEDVVHLQKEELVADAPAPVDGTIDGDVNMDDAGDNVPDAKVLPMATSDDVMDITKLEDAPQSRTPERRSLKTDLPLSPKVARSPNERRFKDLMGPSGSAEKGQLPEVAPLDEDVSVSAALHPATAALYVRDLVRPMNPTAFRDHLNQLATPPSASPSQDLISAIHVDALRTHAFILFTSTTAASRARASLHARVWPPEPTRKPLWVDFIPEDKVAEWTETELANGGSRPSLARRWEVLYDASADGSGDVHACLVEVGAGGGGAGAGRQPSTAAGMPGAPSGPRAGIAHPARVPSLPQPGGVPSGVPAQTHPSEATASFLELDKLFQSTVSKPKLYWLPVQRSLVDKRLDELARQTSRDWDPRRDAQRNRGDLLGRGLDQLRRFTFEDGDVLVDGGPEFGGGRAFGRDGGGGGGYRGGGGGGYRGGGGRGIRRGGDRYR